jgi:hypothetical protein
MGFLSDGYFWLGLLIGIFLGGALLRSTKTLQNYKRRREPEPKPYDSEWFFEDRDHDS